MDHLTSMEKTFVMVKPDGVKRGLVGKIFRKFEEAGLKLVACRMIKPSKEQAFGNYPSENAEWLTKMGEKTYQNYNNDIEAIKADLGTENKTEIGKKILDSLVGYITSGPVILMVWEGNHAVKVVRKLAGQTDPTVADSSTIRGTYGYDTPMLAVKSGRIVFQNLLHISDSAEEAEREIIHWFGSNYKYLGDYERIDYVGAFDVLT